MSDRADVYFNLHRKTFSVRVGGHVVDHADYIVLRDCTFVVQPAGRRRVQTSGVKNVHAFVRGIIDTETVCERVYKATAWRARYSPFEFDSFITTDSEENIEPIFGARLVLMEINNKRPQVWAWTPRRER